MMLQKFRFKGYQGKFVFKGKELEAWLDVAVERVQEGEGLVMFDLKI
jgi:hypothetical protein